MYVYRFGLSSLIKFLNLVFSSLCNIYYVISLCSFIVIEYIPENVQ